MSGINIHGYASPESPYTHNDYLAKNRAKTLTEYVRRMVKLPNNLFTVSSTPEDWDGLIAYIKGSNLEHKNAILAIIADKSLNPDARELKIKEAGIFQSIALCSIPGIQPSAIPTTTLLIR